MQTKRLTAKTKSEFKASHQDPGWLISGVLANRSAALIRGGQGSGKSGLARNLTATLTGDAPDWFGHKIHQKPPAVVYANGVEADELDLSSTESADRFIAWALTTGGEGSLIIIDSFQPDGDVESSVFMGMVARNLDRIVTGVKGTVVLVVNSQTVEPHNPLYYSVDTVIQVKDANHWYCKKQRNDVEGAGGRFQTTNGSVNPLQ